MPLIEGINYRRAVARDIFPILTLYQKAAGGEPSDAVLLDAKKLAQALSSDCSAWVVAEEGENLVGLITILIDRENRLANLNRIHFDPAWRNSAQLLPAAMPLLTHYLGGKGVEVLFTNTRALSDAQQELAVRMGVRVLGVFPSASAPSASEARSEASKTVRFNGLLAYFFEGVLERTHRTDTQLHRMLAPFYDIVRDQCALAPLSVTRNVSVPAVGENKLPPLEILDAPRFALHRFERLKSKQALATSFYPFQEPNAIVTDPAQRIEIFIRFVPGKRAAAIIGERIDAAVSPVELYREVVSMLNGRGVSYVETLNDAADPTGIECLMQAGFLPCAYFPCFKVHAEGRRDYAILAHSFERLFSNTPTSQEVDATYLEFLREYYKLEGKYYLDRLKPHEHSR
jgi:hypothetical protein